VRPNTVDKIQVRDNGYGIHLSDFDNLGRRGHTSKIRQFGDLKTVGETSLGLRGEGLASANTLGYVAITTRTSDEAIASDFQLVPGVGGASSDNRKPVPAPVGTTVSVTCLFSKLLVRRKVTVQDALKTMSAIKTLLCEYTMARPHLRLSFKALKEAVPSWSYLSTMNSVTPDNNVDMRRTVTMLFSAEVARQCQVIITSTDELLDGQSTLSQPLSSGSNDKANNFIFESCLPRPDADLAKLRLGGFISVDGRPLSIHHSGIVDKLLIVFHASFGRS
jgi:DNA mismatch repair ATPase MutL